MAIFECNKCHRQIGLSCGPCRLEVDTGTFNEPHICHAGNRADWQPLQNPQQLEPTRNNCESELKPGQPCDHPGCLAHQSHPCEGCGRIGGV